MKLKELMYEWLYENHKYEIKERTILRYESILSTHIIPLFGEEQIDSITPRDIQRWVNSIKLIKSNRTNKPLSASSINTIISVFKLSFNYAVDFELLDHNPTTRIKRQPRKKEENIKAFSRDEQIKLEKYIDNLNNDEYFGIILVLYTGLRLGELLALTWKDINFKTGIMTINKSVYKTKANNGQWYYKIGTPKTNNSIREIPIPNFCIKKLKEMKNLKKSQNVICKNNGEPITPNIIVHKFRVILKKLKIRKLNFHCLRHTFATRALENKIDIKSLSEILGHSSVSTTLNIYAHSFMEYKKQQIKKFKRLI